MTKIKTARKTFTKTELNALPKSRQEAKAVGSKYFYTGRACKRGHVGERYSNGACVSCVAERSKQYAKDNAGAIAEYNKQYRQENAGAIAEYKRQYAKDNAGAIAEQKRQYRQENAGAIAEWNRQYKQDNAGAIAEWNRQYAKDNAGAIAEYNRQYAKDNAGAIAEYRKDNADKYNALTMKRHAQRINATPLFIAPKKGVKESAKVKAYWKPIRKRLNDEITTFYTEAKRLTELHGEPYHVDHIIPLQGQDVNGLHVPWNLQVITATENFVKNNNPPEGYQDSHVAGDYAYWMDELLEKAA